MKRKRKIVVLTGAGISAESGLQTFRDSNGLWEQHRIEEVATPEAWERDPKLVLDFYNSRRIQAKEAQPNKAHYALAKLESKFKVVIVTQNVDDLHERAGSSHVIHLHGSLNEARSSQDQKEVIDISECGIHLGDLCSAGHQLRPNIVWFGEPVPLMTKAIKETAAAVKFIIVGTSLEVYPAAALVDFFGAKPTYYIDPNAKALEKWVTTLNEKASSGVPKLADKL